jgi:hypothetical protein
VWFGKSYTHIDNIVGITPTPEGVWVTCKDISKSDGYNSTKLTGDDKNRFLEVIDPYTIGGEK